jgi:hypothetical protein
MTRCIRDATHRVDYMLVEARGEAEAVLAGEIASTTGSRTSVRNTAGFAAKHWLALEYLNLKATFGEFILHEERSLREH